MSATPLPEQPNMVLINCDDLGYGDLGCYGSTLHDTPALDQMAAEGTCFTDFYMAAPVCSPSRAGMMTGCYPQRIGLETGCEICVLRPGEPIGLNSSEVTIAAILKRAGVRVMRTAFQAPNMNALAERWVQSIKRECLDKLILFGERRLRTALDEYVAHYNAERPHQGIGNELVSGRSPAGHGGVVVDERLGGLLKSYRRSVA